MRRTSWCSIRATVRDTATFERAARLRAPACRTCWSMESRSSAMASTRVRSQDRCCEAATPAGPPFRAGLQRVGVLPTRSRRAKADHARVEARAALQ